MARSARTRTQHRSGWPGIEAGIAERLCFEPATGRVVGILALVAVALYVRGLAYPPVFGDFVYLSAAQLHAYARALPDVGATWLANATFGWFAAAVGTDWPWQRALNIALHAAAVVVAFALFRRMLAGTAAGIAGTAAGIAGGWIAFLAAGLFALHPLAVYGVAYLSARFALLLALCSLIALWSTARSLQIAGRNAWLIGPAATATALACSPSAIAIPLAMALLAAALPAGAAGRRRAWAGVGLASVLALAYAAVLAASVAPGPESASYLDALAASSGRFLRYLGLWLVPVSAWTAIDLPEPRITIALAWPGWLGILGLSVLLAAVLCVLLRRKAGLVRCAALALGCSAALYCAELLWPRLSAPFALARSYAFMPCIVLVPACLVACIPGRGAWIGACAGLMLWLALATDTLQTFSSHSALWDDAVRRAERVGPQPQDARIYLNRATLQRHEGYSMAALADYDRALALQPDMTRALRGRAQVYINEKRYGEALRDLDRVIALEPGLAIAHADRGLALMQAGRLNEAGREFDRAIERGVKEPRVFLNRGLARLQLGALGAAPAALVDIERALALDPGYALAYYNRAILFEQAANGGVRLRDALSPELMRAVATQNMERACQLGHAPACDRARASAAETLPGTTEGPLRVTPESLRDQGLRTR